MDSQDADVQFFSPNTDLYIIQCKQDPDIWFSCPDGYNGYLRDLPIRATRYGLEQAIQILKALRSIPETPIVGACRCYVGRFPNAQVYRIIAVAEKYDLVHLPEFEKNTEPFDTETWYEVRKPNGVGSVLAKYTGAVKVDGGWPEPKYEFYPFYDVQEHGYFGPGHVFSCLAGDVRPASQELIDRLVR